MEPFIPFTANLSVILAIFSAALVAFDIILVRVLKLGKTAWKRVDYIWLAFGALGLVGAVAQVRRFGAAQQLAMHETFAEEEFKRLRAMADEYSSDPGIICRTFVRSELSPPPEQFLRTQEEYDVACDWAKKAAIALGANVPSPLRQIEMTSVPTPPIVSDDQLNRQFKDYSSQVHSFNHRVSNWQTLVEQAGQSEWEVTLTILSPFLLSIALALRITKVTGEIKLESER
jgi:hypothetical protein